MSNGQGEAAYGNHDILENIPFGDIRIGSSATLTRRLEKTDIELFAAVSGDVNPTHLDESYLEGAKLDHIVGHGLWGAALISALIGTKLPGPGTDCLAQRFRFRGSIAVGDVITARVIVKEKHAEQRRVVLDCVCFNQDGDDVITGSADVLALESSHREYRSTAARVQRLTRDGHEELLAMCDDLDPLPTAVVHPCDAVSLTGPLEAAEAGLIRPILIAPESKLRSLAEELGLNLDGIEIVDVEHSHAAAAKGVELARQGSVSALMKGSLHTDELMGAVVSRSGGLRTERRVSHVFVMNVPTYPRPLLITDAAINIAPGLEAKADICGNAIELAQALGCGEPRVAILSALEKINEKVGSTLEAAALCKMAERGQITGGVLDGPLAFDDAVSETTARAKGLTSSVAGQADIFLVPDLESGNMLAKQLTFMAAADAAGIVLGAKVPIILTSRADNVRTRFASCAVAVLYAAHQKRQAGR